MTIYGYARESTKKQDLGLKSQVLELKKAGCDRIVEDFGQSGETNLIESKAWDSIADEIQSGDTLLVWSQSRLGRESYEVSFVIGRLTKRGISVHILEENRIISNLDDFGQNSMMTLKGLADHNERVEVKKRTKKALAVLKEANVALGRKPTFNAKDVLRINELRAKGLGYRQIARLVPWKDESGKTHVADPKTIRFALSSEYVNSDEWDRRNQIARLSI